MKTPTTSAVDRVIEEILRRQGDFFFEDIIREKLTTLVEKAVKEKIICAAIQWNNLVWKGHRHPHALEAMVGELSWDTARKDLPKGPSSGLIQGFVTSSGRFVDRKEAMKIFITSGGVSHDPGGFRGDELYSEDLY